MQQKECRESPMGKHRFVSHTPLRIQSDIGMIEGTKICEYCKKEISESQYIKIQNSITEKRYQKIHIVIMILTIVVTILIAISPYLVRVIKKIII